MLNKVSQLSMLPVLPVLPEKWVLNEKVPNLRTPLLNDKL
jgi:hypothetical protein